MGKNHDPRLTELPMTDKDIRALEKNLKTALTKSPAFFSWSDFWQLVANQPSLPDEKIKEMEAQLAMRRYEGFIK
jgi:hypothetical protein